jgi:hypothetical protein
MSDNELIATFMGYHYYPWQECQGMGSPGWKSDPKADIKILYSKYLCRTSKEMKYGTSWDWFMPVRTKIAEIGLWMFTNGHDKLWLTKGKEIERAIIGEETPAKAAALTAQLFKWYNEQPK